ncbi:GntR family transcriptional regulator [Murinocardiopsis flavida]|uniref:GntR family transcriptional regulator n=1 Tax=Murinocardiopsis flavida TaxID=645275 RepID=A0A2P8DTU6_9ACTN|nr:FadR/GntR family transcriptional regulator [Murinocardiopsis flavida]PSL00634.1 GntR family transcriptional regulator [Murinocardiopsis flavida]
MWQHLGSGSIRERIEHQVLRVIEEGRLKPGERLPPERELAATLGVSRPSLREALRFLQSRGVLSIRHGVGVFVEAPAPQDRLYSATARQQMTLEELFAMREVLEVPAAQWAAERRDPDGIEALTAAYESMQDIAATDRARLDFAELGAADARFHMAIVDAAGNRFLQQTLGVLQRILAEGMETTLTVPGRLERSRAEHERIFTAIVGGDPGAAKRHIGTHIRNARKAAMGRLAEAGSEAGRTVQHAG